MVRKICGCGDIASISRTYFKFSGSDLPIQRKKVSMCEECFQDHDIYCETHGACDYTNSPEILKIHGCGIDGDVVISLCFACIRDMVHELNSEVISTLKKDYLNSKRFKETEYLLLLGETYLPKELFNDDPLITGLMLYKYIATPESGQNEVLLS